MKQQKVARLFKSAFLMIVIAGVIGLMVHLLLEKPPESIEEIQLGNNLYLNSREYLKQSNLVKRHNFEEKSPYELKSILEKHPYIEQADVVLTQKRVLKVTLHEKRIIALLNKDEGYGLLTINNEILPIVDNLQFTDIPVVSGAATAKTKSGQFFISDSLFAILKSIVTYADASDAKVRLSEVILKKDKDILLMYSGINGYIKTNLSLLEQILPVVNQLIAKKSYSDLLQNCNYIDMRFEHKVYIATHKREETRI